MTSINNFAEDLKVLIDVPFRDIAVAIEHSDLLLRGSTTNVNISNWSAGSRWQHVLFVSNDFIRFAVVENDGEHPFLIDLREENNGVVLDLESSLNSNISESLAKEIKTVLDSPHDDRIAGNQQNNFLSCSGGSDTLSGRGGRDTYVIDNMCTAAIIDNYDLGLNSSVANYDLLLLKCSAPGITLHQTSDDLIITCALQGKTLNITLVHWFTNTVFNI